MDDDRIDLGTRVAGAMASPRLRVAVQGLLLVVLAFLLARLAWQLVTPVGPLGAPPAPVTTLADPALAARAFAHGGPADDMAVAAANGLALFGVRLGADPALSTAILGHAGGAQASYAVGDPVAPGITLAAVNDGYVLLSRGGALIRLSLPDAPASPVAAPVRPATTALPTPTRGSAPADPDRTSWLPPAASVRDGERTTLTLPMESP